MFSLSCPTFFFDARQFCSFADPFKQQKSVPENSEKVSVDQNETTGYEFPLISDTTIQVDTVDASSLSIPLSH